MKAHLRYKCRLCSAIFTSISVSVETAEDWIRSAYRSDAPLCVTRHECTRTQVGVADYVGYFTAEEE